MNILKTCLILPKTSIHLHTYDLEDKDRSTNPELLKIMLVLQSECTSLCDQIFGYRNILSRFFAVSRLLDATKWRFCGR